MANINNIDDNIKLQIINILLNDPSIRNKVNNILDNSNIETDDNGNSIIVNKLDNNNIKIKLLSNDQIQKYIVNGTLDGSITPKNEAVWHCITYIGKTYIRTDYTASYNYKYIQTRSNFDRSCASMEAYYKDLNNFNWFYAGSPSILTSADTNVYGNLSQDNSNSTVLCVLLNTSKNALIVQSSVGPNANDATYGWKYAISKSSYINKSETISYIPDVLTFNSKRIQLRFVFINCFRPAFVIKDTNKSNNIFY